MDAIIPGRPRRIKSVCLHPTHLMHSRDTGAFPEKAARTMLAVRRITQGRHGLSDKSIEANLIRRGVLPTRTRAARGCA